METTRRYPTFILLGFILLMFSGCAPKTTVVLLPDPGGHVGHISVANKAGTFDMTHKDESTVISGRESKPSKPTILSAEEIQARYSHVLDALPEPPKHFILYFHSESTDLTEKSRKELPQILQTIATRKSENISVIGHTDTAGDKKYNLQLSQRRAQAVSRLLIKDGVAAAFLSVTSHGEENPLIITGDNVHEPRNRRVEVVIR